MGIKERKERERQIRKQQIQNTAKKLFIFNGFNSTTMEAIAKEAELSAGTIYQYFKNKGELYASLNLITLQYLLSEVEKVYNDHELSVEEKILKFKDAMYKTFQYDPLLLRNILHIQLEEILPSLNSELLAQINNLSNEIMTVIAKTYEDGVQGGKFRNGYGIAHADIIWGMFTGLVVWEEGKRSANPKKDFLKPTLDKAFDIFCRGIRKD